VIEKAKLACDTPGVNNLGGYFMKAVEKGWKPRRSTP
jgi:hypothetical protein